MEELLAFKGPTTKLLQCQAVVIRRVRADPRVKTMQFEVFASNTEGEIPEEAEEPIFTAIETTSPATDEIEKVPTLEKIAFSLRVDNRDKANKEITDTPFIEIFESLDSKKPLYKVFGKEKIGDDLIGTIECRLSRYRAQFLIQGSESIYVLDQQNFNRFSLECLVCCAPGTRLYRDELPIYSYEQEKILDSTRDSGERVIDVKKGNLKGPIGRLQKLKKRNPFLSEREILLVFPKSAYDEERSLLLALALVTAAKYFVKQN